MILKCLFCCLYIFTSGYSFCAFGQTITGLEIVAAGRAGQSGVSGTSVLPQTEGEKLIRLRQGLAVVDSQSNSVFDRVVAVGPSPSSSPESNGGPIEVQASVPTSSGGFAQALGSPTPAAVTIVEKVGQPDVAVAGSKVLSAVVGAPGSDSPGEPGDLLDGVLEAQNGLSDRALASPSASPSAENGASPTPSVGDGVIITGEPALRSASPAPSPSGGAELPEAPGTPSVSPTPAARNDSNANPAVELPAEPLPEPAASPPAQTGPDTVLPSPSASPSPSPESSAAVQDKVYDLVSGRLPDRNSVRGPAEPRVGFYRKAPEAKTAGNLFLEASGADLPREEAEVW